MIIFKSKVFATVYFDAVRKSLLILCQHTYIGENVPDLNIDKVVDSMDAKRYVSLP